MAVNSNKGCPMMMVPMVVDVVWTGGLLNEEDVGCGLFELFFHIFSVLLPVSDFLLFCFGKFGLFSLKEKDRLRKILEKKIHSLTLSGKKI